jgi:hypothetical protein
MSDTRKTPEIELLFTKERMTVRKKEATIFKKGDKWIDLESFSYKEIEGISGIKLTVVKIDPEIKGDILESLRFHVTDYSTPPDIPPPPDRTRIEIQGEIISCSHQYDILVETANWLIDNDNLKEEDVPIDIGGNIKYLIHSKPEHKDGSKFRSPKELKNGMYIETKSGLRATVEYAKRLLEHFNYSKGDLRVRGFSSGKRKRSASRD